MLRVHGKDLSRPDLMCLDNNNRLIFIELTSSERVRSLQDLQDKYREGATRIANHYGKNNWVFVVLTDDKRKVGEYYDLLKKIGKNLIAVYGKYGKPPLLCY